MIDSALKTLDLTFSKHDMVGSEFVTMFEHQDVQTRQLFEILKKFSQKKFEKLQEAKRSLFCSKFQILRKSKAVEFERLGVRTLLQIQIQP